MEKKFKSLSQEEQSEKESSHKEKISDLLKESSDKKNKGMQ
jgi:hypothetical protein